MNKEEALRLALEALKSTGENNGYHGVTQYFDETMVDQAITAIKAALEAKDEQLRDENERLHVENRRLIDRIETIGVPVGVGGFATTTTSQPDWIERERAVGYREGHRAALAQRTWVGLTAKEREQVQQECFGKVPHHVAFAHAIEAKLKEKNT